MKNECDIVRDLLFSYNDGVLSQTSKELVEEHLKKCSSCRNVFEEIKQDSKETDETKEIDFFKRMKKKLNKKNIIISVSVIFLLFIIIFNVLVFKNYNEIVSTMEIYLKDNITDEEIENIKNKLIEVGDNIELEYISKEKKLERMKSKFENNAYLLDNYEQNNPFPASFEIKTSANIKTLESSIQNMQGIERIVTHENINPYVLFIYNTFTN